MQALLIANTIINKMYDYKKIIRPMKLQKLIFYTLGFYYKYYEEDILDEDFLHYKYGPVIPQVYNTFSQYGGKEITNFCSIFLNGEKGNWIISNNTKHTKTKQIHLIIDQVITNYSGYTDWQLSDKTHKYQSWRQTAIFDIMPKQKIFEDFKKIEYGQ